jgi:nuclear pore complex protein Nup107
VPSFVFYVSSIYNFTFCGHSLISLNIVNGCIGAAIEVITEMSVETISHIRTEALCGYAFDFTVPGSEYQDETQVTSSARKSQEKAGRLSLHPSDIPNATEHAKYVDKLREESSVYFELQQLVRLIMLFRQWREEEDSLIRYLLCFFSSPI